MPSGCRPERCGTFWTTMRSTTIRNSTTSRGAMPASSTRCSLVRIWDRKQMAEFMPFVQQLVNTPPMMQAMSEAGEVFDAPVFIKTWAQLAGFPYVNPFFRKMTPEEKQRRDANSQAALQAQKENSAAALQELKGNQKQQEIASEALGRAAEKTTQLLLQHTMQGGSGEGGEIG